MTDELLTSAEVRAVLKVGANALTRYLHAERDPIPHFRLGSHIRHGGWGCAWSR